MQYFTNNLWSDINSDLQEVREKAKQEILFASGTTILVHFEKISIN